MYRLHKNVVLIADLDNTLYNFVDYFAPSFRAMVHALARRLSLEEEILIAAFRGVFERHGSVEYPFAIQELHHVTKLSRAERERVVHVGRVAFGQTRKKRLVLYEGVKDTLRWFTAAGGTLCAVTNAPAYPAYVRLRQLGIEAFFSGIAAWEGTVVPASEAAAADRYERKLREVDETKQLSIREKHLVKPDRSMFREVFRRFGRSGVHVFAVGDSIQKDLAPCVEFGARTIWAGYGRETEPRNQELLDHLTPWARSEFDAHYGRAEMKPDFIIERFADIRECLPIPYQRSLL